MTGAARPAGGRGSPVAAARHLARRHRAALSAGLAAAAVVAALLALSPSPPPRVVVLAAARELPAGGVLGRRDLTTVLLPPAAVPAGALRPGSPVLGRAVAGRVRRGEALTDARLVGPGLLAGLPAATGGAAGPPLVAAPVRIADAGAAALVRPGDRVDLLATPPDGGGPAVVVAGGVLVLAAPGVRTAAAGDTGDTGDGALLVVATSGDVAAELARAAVGDRLSLTLRG